VAGQDQPYADQVNNRLPPFVNDMVV